MSGTVGSIGGGGSASQPDFEFEILCDTNLGVVTKFLRRYKTDSAGTTTVVNTRLDGATAYNPVGTVDVCKDACESVVVLCDNTGEFLRHYGCDGTTRDTALDGTTAYNPVGTVRACDAPVTVESRIINVAAGVTQNIAAAVPAGKTLISLSFSVLSGTATVTNQDNSTVTLLPSNYSASWSANDSGVLTPPLSITAVAGTGRVVITMAVR